jgi:hypothetical protein
MIGAFFFSPLPTSETLAIGLAGIPLLLLFYKEYEEYSREQQEDWDPIGEGSFNQKSKPRQRTVARPMLSRRYPRVRRAIRFFELSSVLFVVVLFWWFFNRLLDALPAYPFSLLYLVWVGLALGYIAFVAFFLWVFSKLNKHAWKNMARMLGWEDENEKTA